MWLNIHIYVYTHKQNQNSPTKIKYNRFTWQKKETKIFILIDKYNFRFPLITRSSYCTLFLLDCFDFAYGFICICVYSVTIFIVVINLCLYVGLLQFWGVFLLFIYFFPFSFLIFLTYNYFFYIYSFVCLSYCCFAFAVNL